MKKQQEHSPLPWRVTEIGDTVLDRDGKHIATCFCEDEEEPHGIDCANAALIVAGVNAYGLLQSALSFALNSLEEITDPNGGCFITGPMHERAKEAMKCARAALGREADDGQE